MKIALYGMPCAGKTTLLSKVSNAKVLSGSQELRRICGGSFSELTETEKRNVRIKYTEYVNSLNDKLIISDGHYSFMEDIVFTESDGELYDVFMYLYCEPDILLQRYKTSEKNSKFADFSYELISEWQEFEIRSLRNECQKRNKSFYVISDGLEQSCAFDDFVDYIYGGFDSYAYAESLASEIEKIYPESEMICIVDGDKTIIKQDSFRYCCNGKTKVFDGDYYTGYQSFLFERELSQYITPTYDIDGIDLNEKLFCYLSKRAYIILSSGISNLWNEIADNKHLNNVFADPKISADVKYYVVKILRTKGYYVEAFGDSKIDLYMLREADHGTLIIGDRLSESLKAELINGIDLCYDSEPMILSDIIGEDIIDDINICKSSSGICGGKLAAAHYRLGQKIAKKMTSTVPERGTAILVLDRGGRFFGDGVYTGFGGTLYVYNPSKDEIPVINEERIIIVDSVVNTGKSIIKLITKLRNSKKISDIYIAANVMQKNALSLFEGIKIFTVRVSDNSFVGKNQATQVGKTGPDTADRLFNLIERRFDLLQ